jgi:phage-related tail protein
MVLTEILEFAGFYWCFIPFNTNLYKRLSALIIMTTTKKEAERSFTEYDAKRELRTELSEQNHAVDRALNETRDNIRRAVDEARKEIPRNTQAINDYQEHTLQSSKEIADSYLESQKEIIKSYQSTWAPYIENMYNAFWSNWASPQRAAEIYARTVSNFADNVMAASRIANNTLFMNIGAYKTFVQREKDDVKEFSRMAANSARTFENNSREFVPNTRPA